MLKSQCKMRQQALGNSVVQITHHTALETTGFRTEAEESETPPLVSDT